MRKLAIILLALLIVVLLGACEPTTDSKVYYDNVQARKQLFLQAQAMYPMPVPSDFPLRKDLVQFTMDEAKPGPWYVYVQTDSGTYSAYYVARNKPQNSCNFLSDTQDYSTGSAHQAPSLDGVYYGGTGASGACDAWFWYDAGTGALVETRFKTTVSNQPLAIDVPEIKVKVK